MWQKSDIRYTHVQSCPQVYGVGMEEIVKHASHRGMLGFK
jgi:hypothetical protein